MIQKLNLPQQCRFSNDRESLVSASLVYWWPAADKLHFIEVITSQWRAASIVPSTNIKA